MVPDRQSYYRPSLPTDPSVYVCEQGRSALPFVLGTNVLDEAGKAQDRS